MAAPKQSNAVSPDTPITIKVTVNDAVKKLKLPLRDLGITVLPGKLRQVLNIEPEQHMILERYSDSVGGYITLDESNPQVFKTLIRAAKAKLKLRLKVTVKPNEVPQIEEKETVEPTPTPTAMEPVISPSRDSTAFDRRSVGSGIFQFREARASQQTLVNDEAPVPRPFQPVPTDLFHQLATKASKPELAFRSREQSEPNPNAHAWSVYCNACDKAMLDAHFHCSICDEGDYDLCEQCVADGKMCPGEGHWLIKRFILNNKVVNSTTERILSSKDKAARSATAPEPVVPKAMPGAFTAENEIKTFAEKFPAPPTRTCNSCVIVLPEHEFVTCNTCDDFDLCIKCHSGDKHGHHPAHGFRRATEQTVLPLAAETKLPPGRNVRHNAICDGCDKKIYGVRHKCLNCPDWDYCNDCVKDARNTHPRHRFAALYQPIADQMTCMVRHFGIYCDGPLCSGKAEQTYIQGVRYKCTICHDTDFCASCEALPGNHHNRTHPLLKLKTPVRNVNISTENSDQSGNVRVMGDRRPEPVQAETRSAATETTPIQQTNAATQVQTVAEIKPTEIKPVEAKPLEIKKSASPIPIPIKKFVEKVVPAAEVQATQLSAHFVHDSIPDGHVCEPETRFAQIWTLRNPGPYAWPAGCSVRYVGGDNMLNVDNSHPASVTDLAQATESNVVAREVGVGEEIAFKVMLKAPKREGKSISYWRLKSADGTPFGHRLWCDIEVKKTEPEPLSRPPYSGPIPNEAQMAQLKRHASQLRQTLKQVPAEAATVPAMPPFPSLTGMLPQVPFTAPPQMPMPPLRLQQPPVPAMPSNPAMPSMPAMPEQPPAYYDAMNLSNRLAQMREQQKQRREQMIAQLQAQREQLQASGIKREDMPSWRQHGNPAMGNNTTELVEEKERRELLKQRVAHIKANILKTRGEREKLRKEQLAAAIEKGTNDEAEKVKKIVEEATKVADEEEKLDGSQMVFPKLDKESPASSTYQSITSNASKGKAAYVENEDGEVERAATPAGAEVAQPAPSVASTLAEDDDDFESIDNEIEVLSAAAAEEESEDDGFVTDEEYDILDASDDETIASTK